MGSEGALFAGGGSLSPPGVCRFCGVGPGSEWIEGSFPDAGFYDDEDKDADGDAFYDIVGEIGEGRGELFQEEAADEEDQGEAHQDYFERTIHFSDFGHKGRGLF